MVIGEELGRLLKENNGDWVSVMSNVAVTYDKPEDIVLLYDPVCEEDLDPRSWFLLENERKNVGRDLEGGVDYDGS